MKQDRRISTSAASLASQDLRTAAQVARELNLSESTVRGWRFRYQLGIRIGRIVYFRPDEVERIARATNQGERLRGIVESIPEVVEQENRRRQLTTKEANELGELRLRIRPDVRKEAVRQARKVKLSLSEYLQLLVFQFASERWRKNLNPPLEF